MNKSNANKMLTVGDIMLWKTPGKTYYNHMGIAITPYKIATSRGEFRYPIQRGEVLSIPMHLDADQKKTVLGHVPTFAKPDYSSSMGSNPTYRKPEEQKTEEDWKFVQMLLHHALHYRVERWQDLLLRQEQHCTYDETIFVSIPSYRDPQCFNTIRNLWSNATQPQKIYVGVCQQNESGDQDVGEMVKELFPSLYENNFFILRMDAHEATGPCLAREMIENFLLEDQDFVLMVDSHTLFKEDWDTLLIHEWKSTQDPKAILTTYPNEYSKNITWANKKPTFLKARKWAFVKFPLYVTEHYKTPPSKPIPSIVLAAGFCFLPREAVEKSPYVANVPFSFIGEETVMAIKYYTHGFNLYAPTEEIVQTSYDRKERPNFHEVVRSLKSELRDESNERLLDIACGRIPSELGEERLVEEYYTYSGLDIRNGSINSLAQHGVTNNDMPEDALTKWGTQLNRIHSRMAIRR